VIEIEWNQKALDDLQTLSAEAQQAIYEKIDTLQHEGIADNPDVKLISDAELGKIWSLRIKPGTRKAAGEGIDHRALFDIDNSTIHILRILHRDTVYDR